MKLYFYRLTKEPKHRTYYNYTKGIAGFKNPSKYGNKLLFHGTVFELEKWLDSETYAKKPYSDFRL